MIELNNLTTVSIDEDFVKGLAKKVLKGENREEADLSIAFVGQGRMRKLNKKYCKKNKVTDVLSFGNELNEVVICLREVKKNAKRFTPLEVTGSKKKQKAQKPLTGFDSSFDKELAQVLVHGILHLSGYDHENEKDAEKMQEKQKHYLNLLKC